MSCFRQIIAALFLLGNFEELRAQSGLTEENIKNNDGVSGLVVNMTMSTDGINFYKSFLEFWREKPNSDVYSLEIGERSSKRFGNQVWVMYGQNRLFFSNLPYKLDKIKTVGEQAADVSYEAILGIALQLNEKDIDLAAEEF